MLRFDLSRAGLRSVLCLGAHSDDIEIGCGGLVLKLREELPDIRFSWVVFSADDKREKEARDSAARFLGGAEAEVIVHRFRDGFLPWEGASVKTEFENLKRVRPDLVLTHFRDDRHQDHRMLHDLTWNTFRDHFILEYEIPKFDGDLSKPNLFVPLSASQIERKIELLMDGFASQRSKDWFSPETFRGLARLRGIESRASDGFAEAFHGRKLVL